MAKTRPSLRDAVILLERLLTGVANDVLGTLRRPSDSDALDKDKAKSRSGAGVIPMRPESCPPDQGRLVIRRWHMSDVSREYQARVTGFPPYMEWEFAGIEFDGYRSSECRLQEAKAEYDQFFDRETGLPKGFFVTFGGLERTMQQARKQSKVVRSNPPTKLTWYFMQPNSYKHFSKEFRREGLWIQPLLIP